MKKKNVHPYIPELIDLQQKGKVTRREFIRHAVVLGMSVGAASQIAGLIVPKLASADSIQRGGTLRVSSRVTRVVHPAAISVGYLGNQLIQIGEGLVRTDWDNISRPLLLKNWEVSDDAKTWTLNLREGIKFNNGDEFTADDVIFTINQWLNRDVGSSLYGLMAAYLSPAGIEKASKYQVILNLDKPEITVPEHLGHYPGIMLNHRTFEGDFIKQPHGTGPYTLETFRSGEFIALKRRDDYWQKGVDGKALPYMDGMKFLDLGEDITPQINALKNSEIDMIDLIVGGQTEAYLTFKDNPNVNLSSTSSSVCKVFKLRSDIKPFSDNRVRMAFKLCQNREKLMSLDTPGILAADFHVYPGHQDYCAKPIPKYDPQKAKYLLKQAGYDNGLDVTMTVGSGWSDCVRRAEAMKQDAAPAGFRIKIELVPNNRYWEIWTEIPLGITTWLHRPLGSMMLSLIYTSDESGKPVPWNETHWVDEEFNKYLRAISQTPDIEERRKIMCKLEEIQMTRGSIGLPAFNDVFLVTQKRVKDAKCHPNFLMQFNEVWLEKA